MILSVSRRTDIPNYYSDWFFSRIREGFVYVRNPINLHQISKVAISPELVDCIVFWTKNPSPMLSRLDEIKGYKYYFQFTLTGYGKDIEPNLPHKREEVIPIFQKLSGMVGSERVIWRYDPIIFNGRYTPEYHLKAFEEIAGKLRGYASKCVISFVDVYAKNKKNMEAIKSINIEELEIHLFAKTLSEIAGHNGITIETCAEKMDLKQYGIAHGCCIDRFLIENIIGSRLNASKDRNQRMDCGCAESIDIGLYNTCGNGCKYCYANYKEETVAKNNGKYDKDSPLLCGRVSEGDKITERKVKALRENNGTEIQGS